ncbi:MAG: hypothetical protein WA755_01800 [Candidatus Acidiferrales bacterium]
MQIASRKDSRRYGSSAICGIALTILFAACLFARSGAENGPGSAAGRAQKSDSSAKSESVVATGCLVQRTEEGGFAFTTADAKLYYVSSTTIDLSKHAGHKVKITGTNVHQADPKHNPENSSEADELIITKLEMVSKRCQ